MEILETILALIVTLSILITIHELGHFWVARWCGVKVLRFSVGFGKPVFTYRSQPVDAPPPSDQAIGTRSNEPAEGTEWVVAAIPLGGYVKMLDEREGFVADDERHLAFNRRPVWQRIAIAAAGPLANFILAILAYWLLFSVGVAGVAPILGDIDPASKAGRGGFAEGQEILAVDGQPVTTWTELNFELFQRIGDTGTIEFRVRERGSDGERSLSVPIDGWLADEDSPYPTRDLGLYLYQPTVDAVIGRVVEGGRAEASGLRSGDRIEEINGVTIVDWMHFVSEVQARPEQELTIRLTRDGREEYLGIRPERVERDGSAVGYIGAGPKIEELPEFMRRTERYSIVGAIYPALQKTWEMTYFTLATVKKMIVGAVSPSNVSGPITIAKVASASAKSGFESYVGFIALLSISLGVLNLLPIPILDGGHLLYYTIELVARRPVPERIQLIGLQVGVFLLVGIMVLAFYNDIARF